MDISIIIITYNRNNLLLQCIDSLVKQNYDPYEVIIIDDGSDDGTQKAIKNLMANHKNIRYFKQQHKGTACARNLGIKKSNCGIIAFIDDDSIADKNWIRNIVHEHKKHPEFMIIGGRTITAKDNFWGRFMDFQFSFYLIEQSIEKNLIKKIRDYFSAPKRVYSEGMALNLPTCNISYKTKLFKEVGLFNENLKFSSGEDTEFNWRLEKRSYKIFYQPQIIVKHFHRENILLHLRRYYQYGIPLPTILKSNQGYPCLMPNKIKNIFIYIKDTFFATALKIFSIKKLKYLFTYPLLIFLDETMFRIGIIYSYFKKL